MCSANAREPRPLRVVESRGADDRADAVPRAGLEVSDRAFGPREVDQHIGRAHRRVDVGTDDDAGRTTAAQPRILARERALRDVERRCQRELGIGQHRLDQRLTHAAARAGDGDPDHRGPFMRWT